MRRDYRIEFHDICEERNTFLGSFGRVVGEGLGCILVALVGLTIVVGLALGGAWLLSGRERPANQSAALPAPGTTPAAPPAPPGKQDPQPEAAQPVPPDDPRARAAKLAAALVDAAAGDLDRLLATYREAKGGEYTEAMAHAAGKAVGDRRAKIREALTTRMGRMTVATLTRLFRDRDAELRRAAALAAGAKGDRGVVPDLIRLLGDDDPEVIQAGRAGLRALTGQDHGPEPGAAAGDRLRAVIAWRQWQDTRAK